MRTVVVVGSFLSSSSSSLPSSFSRFGGVVIFSKLSICVNNER